MVKSNLKQTLHFFTHQNHLFAKCRTAWEAVSYFWWPKKHLVYLFYWDNRLFSTKYLLLVTRSWYDMTQFSFLDTFPIIASIMSLLVHVCLSKCVSHSTHFVLTCAFTKCTSDPLCIMFQTSKVYLDSFLRLRR